MCACEWKKRKKKEKKMNKKTRKGRHIKKFSKTVNLNEIKLLRQTKRRWLLYNKRRRKKNLKKRKEMKRDEGKEKRSNWSSLSATTSSLSAHDHCNHYVATRC